MKATRLTNYKGKPVYRFPVKITFGEYASLAQENHYPTKTVEVIAHKASDAGWLMRDETRGIPCVEIEVFGPRGGVAWKSFRGWESAIGEQIERECWQRDSNTRLL
jgi:hypothetical protein